MVSRSKISRTDSELFRSEKPDLHPLPAINALPFAFAKVTLEGKPTI